MFLIRFAIIKAFNTHIRLDEVIIDLITKLSVKVRKALIEYIRVQI